MAVDRAVRTTRLTKLDASRNPKELDLALDPPVLVSAENKNKFGGATTENMKGIYKLDGNKLTWCLAPPGKSRPREFATPKGSGFTLVKLERVRIGEKAD